MTPIAKTPSDRFSARLRSASAAVLRSLALPLLLALPACSGDDEPEYVERPPEEPYRDANDAMQDEEYRAAAGMFDEAERPHPYLPWATQAQLRANGRANV